MSISFFGAGEGWWVGFKSMAQSSKSSEVEHKPKASIYFFGTREGWWMGSSPLPSPPDHQWLNIIQKWAFHFSGLERGSGWGLSLLLSPYLKWKFRGFCFKHKIKEEGWGNCLNAHWPQLKWFFSIAFMFSPISIPGGTLPTSNVTVTYKVNSDPNSNFSFLWGGVPCLPILGRLY